MYNCSKYIYTSVRSDVVTIKPEEGSIAPPTGELSIWCQFTQRLPTVGWDCAILSVGKKSCTSSMPSAFYLKNTHDTGHTLLAFNHMLKPCFNMFKYYTKANLK